MRESPVEINEQINMEYIDILNDGRDLCGRLCGSCVEKIKSDAVKELKVRIKKNGGLPSFDEKIFDYYFELISYYKRAAELYSQGKKILSSQSLLKLLDGLNSVIKSRISQFDESRGTNEAVNPIAEEKKTIIEGFASVIEKKFNELGFEGFLCENLPRTDLIQRLNNKFSEKICSLINCGIKKCSTLLNDIEKREAAALYYNMLKEEREILSSVIKVQADALEMQEQTRDEEMLVQSILFQLREAYQYMNKHIDTISEGFVLSEEKGCTKAEAFAFINFEEKASFIEAYRNDIKALEDKFAKFALKLAHSDKISLETKKNKAAFQDCIALCESFIRIFTDISAFYDDIKTGLAESAEKDIADGVYETVKIKTESLNDVLAALKPEADALFEKGDDARLDSEEREKIINELFKGLIVYMEEKSSVEELLLKIKFDFEERAERKNKALTEKINKKLFNFKKEQLLYEISTFEEIMSYSVSRLRESKNTAVEGFVAAIDYGVEEIGKALDKFGISVIRPEAHQMFNGREHEVLMAEKNGEFRKGEIIKVMNSGFKENDCVIIRANVIAAK